MNTTALTPADGSKSGATQTPPLAEACRGPATMPLGILDGAARQPVYTMARQPRPLARDGTPLLRRFSPPIPAPAPTEASATTEKLKDLPSRAAQGRRDAPQFA